MKLNNFIMQKFTKQILEVLPLVLNNQTPLIRTKTFNSLYRSSGFYYRCGKYNSTDGQPLNGKLRFNVFDAKKGLEIHDSREPFDEKSNYVGNTVLRSGPNADVKTNVVFIDAWDNIVYIEYKNNCKTIDIITDNVGSNHHINRTIRVVNLPDVNSPELEANLFQLEVSSNDYPFIELFTKLRLFRYINSAGKKTRLPNLYLNPDSDFDSLLEKYKFSTEIVPEFDFCI